MADHPPSLDPDLGPGPASKPGMPRWVKVFVVIAIVLAVLVVIGLITGQLGPGGPHGPGRHLGARNDATPSISRGVGSPGNAVEAARTIEVTSLDTMSFEPATIAVSSGETVTFSVTNRGRTVHEFTLGDASMQQQHAQAMAHIPAGVAPHFPNSITLQPGETKQLTWRFGDAPLEYACHEPGHLQAGMRGRITIT